MYDPLAIYFLLNPGVCKVRDYDIKIETKGELTRGMCVAELRNVQKEHNIQVVEYIDGEAFKQDFIRILSK